MELREAEASDLPQLAVWNEQLVEDENAPYRLAGREIGYALYRPEDDGYYLRQLVIFEDAAQTLITQVPA